MAGSEISPAGTDGVATNGPGHSDPTARTSHAHDLPLGRAIASGTAWSGIGRLGVLGFGFVGQVLIARLLAPAAFGSYSLILSVAGSLALIFQLGLPQSTVRHIARANTRPEGNRARSVILSSVTLALAVAIVAGVLVRWPVGQLIDRLFPAVRLTAVLGFFAVLVGIRILENITPELFRGVRDFRGGSIFGGLFDTVLLAALAAAVLARTDRSSLETALAITITASAVSLAAAAPTLWRKLRSFPRAPRARLLDFGVLSPAMWFASIMNYAITQLDLWVVGALGHSRDIALYSAAFRLAMLVMTPLTIANFVVPPLVVELLARGKPKRLGLVVQTVATIAGVPAFVALVVFAAFGDWICRHVYGGFYGGAGAPLALLAVGKLVSVLTGPCAITLVMSGGQRMNLRILAINLAMTLPMQIVGFRVAGLAGLAVATSIGFAIQNVHQALAVRRRVGVRTELNIPQTFRLVRDLARQGSLRQLLIPKRVSKRGPGA